MKRIMYGSIFLFILLCSHIDTASAAVTVRLLDISTIDGLKVNQVVGYGIVVGLPGSGDSKSSLTSSSLKNLLKSMGMESDDIASKNTAAVIVTAQLPPFVRVGDRIDLTVSSIGDAKSLEGGMLIQSPLRGADDQIYAVGQGPVSLSKARGGGRVIKTVASITNGGMVEREIAPEIVTDNSMYIVLKNWDYTVAASVIKAIATQFPDSAPAMAPNGKIKITLAAEVNLPEFISTIQKIEIPLNSRAVVAISEMDGTIVTGGDVKISESLVSKEGITIEIANSEKKGSAAYIKDSTTVKDLVDALNSIGASTNDIISIIKGLKEAGSLHADLIIR